MVAIVLVVFLTWLSISSVHSKNDVERYKERLRVAGEKLTVEELVPPRVSPESNGVPIFEEAVSNLVLDTTVFGYNPPHPMVMVAPGHAMIRWQQPDILNNDATNSWEFAKLASQSNSVAIALLQRAAELPQLDFELDYKGGLLWQLSHQDGLRRAALVLESAAVEHLHEGDTADAVTNIHTILAIINAWQDERVLMSQTFRIALAQMAVAAQWELLQVTNVTESQLTGLQRDWTGLEFSRPVESALLIERAMASVTIQELRDTNNPSVVRGVGPNLLTSGDWLTQLKMPGEWPRIGRTMICGAYPGRTKMSYIFGNSIKRRLRAFDERERRDFSKTPWPNGSEKSRQWVRTPIITGCESNFPRGCSLLGRVSL